MYTDEELTRITYSVNFCLFKERDVLVIFVETKADILSPKSFYFYFLLQLHLELNPVSLLFLYSKGTNSKHRGVHCWSLLGPQTYCFVLLVLILTFSRKYLAAVLGICCENEQIFIHWRSSDHRKILSIIKGFSRWCLTRPLAQLANSEICLSAVAIKHYRLFFWFVPKN